MRLLFVVVALAACALNNIGGPERRLVVGTITSIVRDPQYEAPCGLRARVTRACDEVPVCCAYRVTVEDSAAHRTYFMASWPKYAPGLALERQAWFNLTRTSIWRLGECVGPYGCPEDIGYVVESDNDWGYVP